MTGFVQFKQQLAKTGHMGQFDKKKGQIRPPTQKN